MVWFDGSGWCLFSKRLERGTLELPAVESGSLRVSVEPATLPALLEGIPPQAPRRRWFRKKAS